MSRYLSAAVALVLTVVLWGLSHSSTGADAGPGVTGIAKPPAELDGLPLLLDEDFHDGPKALERFDLLDKADWKMVEDGKGWLLSLAKRPGAKTAPTPVRSPFGRAIIKDLRVSQFVMDVRLRSTSEKPYDHQDLCLFFGEQDVSHLYYVHMGRVPDANCGNIYLVDGKPRKNLLPPQKDGIPWTPTFHTALLSRDADGTVSIAFDGKLWLKVSDQTFMTGRLGVGSFDDTGDFARITVWGKKIEPAK